MLANLVLMVHCVMALAIVILVLLQHGKGADMGAAFGSGSAGSLFGSSGAANFLSRSTAVCAAIFFATSLGLTYVHAPKADSGVAGSVMTDGAKTDPAKTDAPKADVIPAPTAAPTAAPAATPAAPAPATTAPATGSTPPASK
ncbi:MAG: preprotein translocase subunit SecG [Betaproteobacteria bacterium]|nr:preprotein translocase subunit SecG [Betaproteobacteria bacterium]